MITATIDHEHKLLFVRAEGPVTLKDIRKHLEEERLGGGLPYRELIDARGYRPAFTAMDVRSIVALLRRLGENSSLGPTAIIVDSDEGYGMLRMVEILVEGTAAIRPFRQAEEARTWLREQPGELS